LEGDHLARLRAAMVTVDGIRTVTDLTRLLTAVTAARDLAPVRKDSGQLEDLGRQFTRFAERLSALPAVGRVPIDARLPTALVGRTGVAAAEGIRVLEGEYARTEQIMRRAATACEQMFNARTEAERIDRTGIDQLTVAARQIEATIAAHPDRQDPGLPGLVRQHREAAIRGLNQRLRSHSDLEQWADSTARLLYDLSSQALLARLGPSPLSAVDEMVIAAAGRDDAWGPVLTAVTAKRAARRLTLLGEAGRAEMEGLLARTSTSHERAYLLKALAAGHSVDKVREFADRIRPFGHDPGRLDRYLAPLDSSSGRADHAATFGSAVWKQGPVPHCVPYSIITARAQVDPVYALELTAGGDPGNPAVDNGSRFAERLRLEAERLYGEGRKHTGWFTVGVSTFGMEQLMDSRLGRPFDVDYVTHRLDRPVDRDTITEITKAVDNGVPVMLGVMDRDGGRGHATMVIGHDGDRVQIYDPLIGGTFWSSLQDVRAGMLDRQGRVTPPVPFVVYLPK
jgi:hypothetical protein